MNTLLQRSPDNSDFYARYRGTFKSVMNWVELDSFWKTLKQCAVGNSWFVYTVGEKPPEESVAKETFIRFVDEIDGLLRKEHQEDYCGIVYVDDKASPTFIKIYDPNNLGVVCGFSNNPPPPGWVLSKQAPEALENLPPLPNNRRRWWQKLWA